MAGNRPELSIPPLTADEQQALEIRWYEGRMLPYVEWIHDFADKHRTELLRVAGVRPTRPELVAAVKDLIIQRGSMHMAAELKDQMREMEKELWYCGEKDPATRAEIKQRWTAKHAAAWRKWRIKEYLFVVDLCQDELAHQLLGPERSAS